MSVLPCLSCLLAAAVGAAVVALLVIAPIRARAKADSRPDFTDTDGKPNR